MQSRCSESIIYRRREKLVYSSRSRPRALLHPQQSKMPVASLLLAESSSWGKEFSFPPAEVPVFALPSLLGKIRDFPLFFAHLGWLLLLYMTLGKSLIHLHLPKTGCCQEELPSQGTPLNLQGTSRDPLLLVGPQIPGRSLLLQCRLWGCK